MSDNSFPIVIGGVGLVKGRIKNFGTAMVAVCNEVRPLIEESDAFSEMPFDEVNLVIRWADEGKEQPEIGPLRKNTRSLEAATTIALKDGKAIENDDASLAGLVKSELRKTLEAIEEKYGMCHIDI